ncbi:MAG: rhomboid family intramembrane serine protease [Candidatus Kapaibacterium sp.]
MKIDYNSPVILSFTLIAVVVMAISSVTGGLLTQQFFSVSPLMSLFSPFTYFRLFSHIIGHADWGHLAGNFSLILLIGPLLEEKYGSSLMLLMILATAFITGVLNMFFFSTGLYGASGIVFMLILLSSLSRVKTGHIPLTFILVVALFLGKEVLNSLKPDGVSQFAHIVGGLCGSIFGFLKREKPVAEDTAQ